MNYEKVFFITGIDTDAGKTIITGAMARYLLAKGIDVITQKLAQTGCVGQSDDILVHRRMMGREIFPEDNDGLTCPYIFPYACSPHLAASMQGERIDPVRLKSATDELSGRHECVLLEGVGGLMVPLNDETLLIDYVQRCDYPVILVTNGKLGSINHTLLSLDACAHRGIRVAGLVFNHFGATDPLITANTLSVFQKKLHEYYPEAKMTEVPVMREEMETVDFEELFS
jgi:dethiobiotin synthetase